VVETKKYPKGGYVFYFDGGAKRIDAPLMWLTLRAAFGRLRCYVPVEPLSAVQISMC